MESLDSSHLGFALDDGNIVSGATIQDVRRSEARLERVENARELFLEVHTLVVADLEKAAIRLDDGEVVLARVGHVLNRDERLLLSVREEVEELRVGDGDLLLLHPGLEKIGNRDVFDVRGAAEVDLVWVRDLRR